MKAGIPEVEEDYEKREIEGITFYVRKDLSNKKFQINWVGFWFFGQFVVQEL